MGYKPGGKGRKVWRDRVIIQFITDKIMKRVSTTVYFTADLSLLISQEDY